MTSVTETCPACWMDPTDHKYEDCPEWAGQTVKFADLEWNGTPLACLSDADWEEQDREAAARAFVNHAADIALRQSLGALCKSCVCGVCGITFLSASDKDDRCHVDVSR